jgi:hypothetical protein
MKKPLTGAALFVCLLTAALSAEILEAIRTTVREEISRAGLTPGAERKKTQRPPLPPRDREQKRAIAAKNPKSRRHDAR